MHEHGIDVIPTVSWSTSDSYRYAFAGIPQGSVVALSAVGARGDQAEQLFADGFREMLDRVQPPVVLAYGQLRLPIDVGDYDAIEYPTRWER
jgi:tryptophan synthase alpha subunit